ncbi:MAG TPA: hypothetical protein PLZ36_00910 [Armatimonadota bacterium]|nr:hypothetical protein [Armatimonadota bacterium]
MADPDMLFHLDLKDAKLERALDDLFAQAGRAFLVEDPLPETISVRADDLGFRDALALLLPPNYTAMEEGGVYHIKRAA